MNKDNKAYYAPGYDLFKMVFSVILGSLFVVLLLRDTQSTKDVIQNVTIENNVQTTNEERPVITVAPQGVTETTDVIEETPPLTLQEGSELSCPVHPSRLQVGDTVMVKNWVNLRDAPNLSASILKTHAPGTTLEVIGEPVCSVFGEGSQKGYLWWQVRLPNGQTGWSVEAPINSEGYFLEPLG